MIGKGGILEIEAEIVLKLSKIDLAEFIKELSELYCPDYKGFGAVVTLFEKYEIPFAAEYLNEINEKICIEKVKPGVFNLIKNKRVTQTIMNYTFFGLLFKLILTTIAYKEGQYKLPKHIK